MKSMLLVALLLSLATAAGAAPPTVVYPTGTFPLDVQNVQAALDGGGTVLLKAVNASGVPTHFNFGPSSLAGGSVEFHVDAELTGERVAADAETVVEGGWYCVRAFGAAQNVAVRNIAFVSSFDGALLLFGANTKVTGNRASHVIGRFRRPLSTTAETFVTGFSGRVLIEDNVISDVEADSGFGVSQFRAAGPVVIRRNTISDTGYGTIESSFNISPATGVPATVAIADNALRPGPAPGVFGVGIEINGEGSYYVARNDIVIESEFGLGIYALGAPTFGIAPMIAPVIEKNDVHMRPQPEFEPAIGDGIDLVGVVSGAYVGQNAIDGDAFSALGLYGVAGDGDDLGFNTYVGNRISGFEANTADVYLDTAAHDTVFEGFSGSVLDFGSNNHITGIAPNGGAATGQRVSEATRRRHDAVMITLDLLRSHGASR